MTCRPPPWRSWPSSSGSWAGSSGGGTRAPTSSRRSARASGRPRRRSRCRGCAGGRRRAREPQRRAVRPELLGLVVRSVRRGGARAQPAGRGVGRRGVNFVGIDARTRGPRPPAFATRHGATYPLLHDTGGSMKSYGVTGFPETFVLDPSGGPSRTSTAPSPDEVTSPGPRPPSARGAVRARPSSGPLTAVLLVAPAAAGGWTPIDMDQAHVPDLQDPLDRRVARGRPHPRDAAPREGRAHQGRGRAPARRRLRPRSWPHRRATASAGPRGSSRRPSWPAAPRPPWSLGAGQPEGTR